MRSAISEFTRPHLRPSFLLLGAFLAVAPISIYGSSQSENNVASTATAARSLPERYCLLRSRLPLRLRSASQGRFSAAKLLRMFRC
jgi:hypothetical protein